MNESDVSMDISECFSFRKEHRRYAKACGIRSDLSVIGHRNCVSISTIYDIILFGHTSAHNNTVHQALIMCLVTHCRSQTAADSSGSAGARTLSSWIIMHTKGTDVSPKALKL